MYLDYSTIFGIMIALTLSTGMLVLTSIANYTLREQVKDQRAHINRLRYLRKDSNV
jgi:hypothetical protein